jgi:error-prone DNA polymerase
MHPSAHPLSLLRQEARRQGCLTTAELSVHRGKAIRLVALVAATRRLATGRGIMQFVTLEDEHGLIEAVLRPGVYASLGDPITNPGPFLVGGKIEEDRGDFHLIVTEVITFHSRPAPYREPANL